MVGSPYMVGSPHTWWPGQPAGQLWGARGGPTGLPAMYFDQRYQLSGITYQVSDGTRMAPRYFDWYFDWPFVCK